MKIKLWLIPFCLSFALLVINSCEKRGCGPTNISATNSDESHKAGQNCMNCHKNGGEGKGCFSAAGTAYDNSATNIYANATVRLYSQPAGAGSVVATLHGDAKGNFYTTDNVDFGSGLYPSVTNSSGQTMYMSASTTTGACNSCHGISQAKISTF